MTTRTPLASRMPADAYATSRDAAALPILMELAVLLESVALLLPDGAARVAEVAAHIFTKPSLFIVHGTEERSTGELISELFRPEYPILLRSWAPNIPECTTFVVDEDGVTEWLRRWAHRDSVSDDRRGRGLAARVDDLQAGLTRRIRRWAGSERVPANEWTVGDRLPDELGSFLYRRARDIAVAGEADGRGYVTLRFQW